MSKSYTKYTIKEEKAIFDKIKNGDKSARAEFIKNNENLIFKIINKFYRLKDHIEDLKSEGYIGLTEAIDKFDPLKGFKFSTYAYPVIKGKMQTYLKSQGINIFDELDESKRESKSYDQESVNTEAQYKVNDILNDPEYKKVTSERDQEISRLLFGVDGLRLNNKEIALKYGISKGRVSHIKKEITERLKILNAPQKGIDNPHFKEQPDTLDIEKNKTILEYLNLMAESYYPAFYGFDEYGEPEFGSTDAPERFITRYNLNHILFKEDYKRFCENTLIYEAIKRFRLDITKFWYLILFLHDDAYHLYRDNIKCLPSPYEQLCPLYKTAKENINNGLSIKINNESSFRIESKGLKYFLQMFEFYALAIREDNHERKIFTSGYPVMGESTTKDNIYIIKKFANSLIDFFKVYPEVAEKRNTPDKPSTRELQLISYLIHFLKLSDQMGYLTGIDAIKKALSYQTEEIKVINNLY